MTWRQIYRHLWSLRYFIAASASVCTLGTYITLQFLPKRYLATATIQLDTQLEANADQYSIGIKQIDNYVKSQAAMIQDRRVTGLVVDRLGWTQSYELAQQYREHGAASGRDFRAWLSDMIGERLILNYSEGSPAFDVGYIAASPVEAQTMVGLVRDAYIETSRQQRRTTAGMSAAFLESDLNRLRQEMQAMERRNADFSKANDVIIQAHGSSLTEMKLRNSAAATIPPIAQQAQLENVAAVPRDRQLADLDAEIARLSTTLGPNHPSLQNLKSQRSEIAAASAKALAPVQLPAQPETDDLENKEAEYLAKAEVIAQAKRYDDELKALEQRFAALTARKQALLLDSTTQRPAASSGGAVKPFGGVFYPRANFALFGAAAFGAVFALLVGLMASLLQMRVRSAEDLRGLGIRVLSEQKASKRWRRSVAPSPSFHVLKFNSP